MPWLILAVGCTLSAIGAAALHQSIRQTTDERFAALINVQKGQLATRLSSYLQVLRGAQGLYRASNEVTRDEWRRYTESQAIARDFPAILCMGLARLTSPTELAILERAVRGEAPHVAGTGASPLAQYRVFPPGQRPEYAPVVFLEPWTAQHWPQLGYDMLSDPVRSEAMLRARDSGEPAATARVTAMGGSATATPPGFMVYIPVYDGDPATLEQRRRRIFGWLYLWIDTAAFVHDALPHRGDYVRYAIYDGTRVDPATLLFESQRGPSGSPQLQQFPVAGHTWTMTYEPGPLLNAFANGRLALAVAAGGALFSLLVAGLALAWARTREAARRMAHDMTADLRRRELELERVSAQLRQSNEDLQQFAYAASHDLKEPLRSIASSLGLLAHRSKGGLDDGAREFLAYANDGAQRLSDLIDNLLDYARIQSQPGPQDVVDLDAALDTALRDLEVLVRDTGTRVRRQRLPQVMGDRGQLIRVLQNLLDNGIRYSSRHAAVPEVSVTARRDGAHWIIGVADNGIGIAPEHQDRIFVMFKRLHSRQEYAGHGMGLAICKRIVQRHGGRIWVQSTPGEGATFFFTLPATATGAPAEAAPAADAPAQAAAP